MGRSSSESSGRRHMGVLSKTTQSKNPMVTEEVVLSRVRSGGSTGGVRRTTQTGSSSPENASEKMQTGGGEKRGLFNGRRRKKELGGRQGTFDSEYSLNFMGRLYTKIVNFSVITRYLLYVVPIATLLAAPIVVLAIVDPQREIPGLAVPRDDAHPDGFIHGPQLLKLFIWFEAAWLSLWAGKIVAHMTPSIFMFFCGVVSSGTRKYATVLRNLEIPLSLFFWALASWLVFKNLFGGEFDVFSWVDTLKKILGALFVSSAILLGERALVQLISITYHQRSFANRIRDSKRDVYLLGVMYEASRTLFPMYCPEFAEEDYIINDSIDVMLGNKGHKRGGSVTPMKLIGEVGRFGDKITSVFGNIASEITGRNMFNPHSAHSVVVEALEKDHSSEALAKRIWMSFVVEDRDALYSEDIEEVLGPAKKEEAIECFKAIDADGNGDISLDEMIRKVVDIGKERKAIANSMKDIGQALAVFDKVLLFIVFLIVVFVFLAFFQSSFITTLATAGTALLSLSFIFAVTTQEFLGSCIFLFVKHPFDVGDRVDITGPEKEQLIVEKISLLYTVFVRIDKMQVVQVPNIVLNNLWIENVTRSKAMKEVIDLVVSYDTSFEDIELLRLEMENFVRHSDNSRDFQPDITISVAGVGDLDKLQLKIAIKHKSNWHNEAVRATRRSKFMCALALALKKVPIYGPGGGNEPLGGPLNPSYSVAVTDEFAAAKRKEAADNKEAKRMVPTAAAAQAGSDTNATSKSETKTSEEHNASNPVADASDNYGYDRHGEGVRAGDNLLERHGTNDADSVRRDHLARESQRGRRRAGETLPPMPLGQSSGVSVGVTPASPRMHNATFASQASRTGSSRSAPPFDPEAQTGVRPPIQPQHQPMAQGPAQPALYPVGGSAAMPGQAAGAAGQQSYLSGQPNPLQSAPSTAAPGSNVPGNQPPGTFRH